MATDFVIRFYRHLNIIMMKRAHVCIIAVIVDANTQTSEFFSAQKHFYVLFGVHRITNPHHIIYVNALVFHRFIVTVITTKCDVKTLISVPYSILGPGGRKKINNKLLAPKATQKKGRKKVHFTKNCSGWRWKFIFTIFHSQQRITQMSRSRKKEIVLLSIPFAFHSFGLFCARTIYKP